jgi:hypothetical protein
LANENGRKGEELVFSLLSKVFDDEITKVKKYLLKYIICLSEQKVLAKPDFSDGISKFISYMPEFSLDVPELHKYLYNFVIHPMIEQNLMSIKFLKFDRELPKPEDPEDDVCFDSSDYVFRLIALILKSEYAKAPAGIDEFVKSNGFTKIFK